MVQQRLSFKVLSVRVEKGAISGLRNALIHEVFQAIEKLPFGLSKGDIAEIRQAMIFISSGLNRAAIGRLIDVLVRCPDLAHVRLVLGFTYLVEDNRELALRESKVLSGLNASKLRRYIAIYDGLSSG